MGHSYRFSLYSIAYEYVIITRVFAVCLSELYCVVFTQEVSGCYAKVIAYYDPINWCITALFMSVRDTGEWVALHCIVLYVHCITYTLHYMFNALVLSGYDKINNFQI